MNPVPVHREMESPISYDHTSLMGKACEHQFFDLDPILKAILTPIFELDLIRATQAEEGGPFISLCAPCWRD